MNLRGKVARRATALFTIVSSLTFSGEQQPLYPTHSVTVATSAEVGLISVPSAEVSPHLPRPLGQIAINSDCFVFSGGTLVNQSGRTRYFPRHFDSVIKPELYEAFLDECPTGSVVAVPASAIKGYGLPSFQSDFATRSFAIEVQDSLSKQQATPRLPLGIIS